MTNDATRDSSRVLSALDYPFLPSGFPQSQISAVQAPDGDSNNPGVKRTSTIAELPESNRLAMRKKQPVSRSAPNVLRSSSGSVVVGVGSSSSSAAIRASQEARSMLSTSPRRATEGFNLNYDQETPLRSIDLGGEDQELKLAEFVTKPMDNSSHGFTVAEAMKRLNLNSEREFLPGLEVRLLPHQLIGVAWMLEQENNARLKGGILADDMGLGKTIQMMAAMAMNLPDPDDKDKSTLIVVPAALLQQWKDEIDTKTNGLFNVHVHHGKDKLKSKKGFKENDVVITTYQTLNMDFSIPKDIEPEEELGWLEDNGGLLSRIKFYRVICDEAQYIRNRGTRSSQSVAMLKAKYRWLLTGTPVTNTLADIYGLIRFGHFRPWNDWNDFNEFIAKVQIEDPPLAGDRAREVLRPLMLRRTKNSELEGKPILNLPPRDIELVTLEFSPDERELYDSFEKNSKLRLSKFIKERTLVKNHAVVLVMILRLRQLCCHPNLILSDDYEDPTVVAGGSKVEKELGRVSKIMGADWTATIKKRFLSRALVMETLDFDEDAITCPVCREMYTIQSARVLACGHEVCFDCLLNLSHAPILHDGEFGHGTEQENIRAEKEYELAIAKNFRPCPTCKKMLDISPEKVFKASIFEPSEEELTNNIRSRRRNGKVVVRKFVCSDDEDEDEDEEEEEEEEEEETEEEESSSGSQPTKALKNLSDSEDDLPDVSSLLSKSGKAGPKGSRTRINGRSRKSGSKSFAAESLARKAKADKIQMDALVAMWKKGDEDVEPSTKMIALVDLLKGWDATGDKTICFSQWTSMLDLVEIVFSRHGIRSLRYDGKMDRAAKDATLAAFRRKGGIKVILVSTKCGGVGLNLVSANRVINLDLSWNYAAESQAYDRVHRLGQEKDVYVKRLVVRDTIEERMLQLQDVKVGLAEAALGEGGGGRLHKLSIKDIQHLFGMTKDKQQAAAAQQEPEQTGPENGH